MDDLSKFTSRPTPGQTPIDGGFIRLEPLDWTVHGPGLGAVACGDENSGLWGFIPMGPFAELDDLRNGLSASIDRGQWACLVIVRQSDQKNCGMASYMRIREAHGSAEVGCVFFGHSLQRTRAATEAMYLMAKHVFDDLGYRRYEWKCHNDNAASKRAAERFGFTFEGVFRNDMVMKGQNRDTAWYSMTDAEWPQIKTGFQAWLADDNFDSEGQQLSSLVSCRG